MLLKMPPAPKDDPELFVRRPDASTVVIGLRHGYGHGAEQSLELSLHNAWSLFGVLSLFLGLPLPKRIGKAIKFGAPGAATSGP